MIGDAQDRIMTMRGLSSVQALAELEVRATRDQDGLAAAARSTLSEAAG